jgi:hypothetical protein
MMVAMVEALAGFLGEKAFLARGGYLVMIGDENIIAVFVGNHEHFLG